MKATIRTLQNISIYLICASILTLSGQSPAQATFVPSVPAPQENALSSESLPPPSAYLDSSELLPSVMVVLARGAEDSGQTAEAVRIYTQVWQLRQAHGAATVNGAIASGRLAFLHAQLGKMTKAEAFGRLSLKDVKAIFGPSGEVTGIALNNLATVEELMHKYTQAELLYEQSIQAIQAETGLSSQSLSIARSNLANLYCKTHRFNEALKQYKLALADLKKITSDRDPEVQSLKTKINQVQKYIR